MPGWDINIEQKLTHDCKQCEMDKNVYNIKKDNAYMNHMIYIILTNITIDSYNFPPNTTIPWYEDTGLKNVMVNLKEALTC